MTFLRTVRSGVAIAFRSEPTCAGQGHWVSFFVYTDARVAEKFGISVDFKKNQIEMSFKKKPGKAAAKQKSTAGLADFSVGQKVDTIVRKVSPWSRPAQTVFDSTHQVEPYGVFLRIDGTNLSGLCHRSEVRSPTMTLRSHG